MRYLITLLFILHGTGGMASELSADRFSAHKTIVRDAVHNGKAAILVEEPSDRINGDEDKLAVFNDTLFQDGVIEVWVSGEKRKGAFAQARGFVGIAFRISEDRSKFEAIYLRPENGRSEDQARRNHAVQYVSYPDYPWHRLRRENPSRYETYADMVPGQWIKYRLEVKGNKARLYLDGNSQPCLVVNDLKLGETAGRVGLWIGPGTKAYFSDFKISK